MDELSETNAAALVGTAIFWDCLNDQRTWTCRYCGYGKNWIATEICDGCHREDCQQGT